MHFHEVFGCVCVCVHFSPFLFNFEPYDFHLWSHDKLEISFSRLHATCNLADYVLGIGAQGRQASEASTLEPGMLCWLWVGGKENGQVTWWHYTYVPDGLGCVCYGVVRF